MNLKSEDKNFIVISGNNIDSLKDYPDNYFDSVVTDPPYGLGKEPNAEEMLRAWIDTGYLAVGGSGFMGKEWDAFVPQPLFWKEIFRVLKHGGHIVAFFGTRTYDWGCMAIRLAGFEIRDCIQWVYGCLSDDTEILTRSGYIQYHKFKKLPNFEQQEILIYDSKTDIYKWEKPERWNDYNIYKDTCYRIKSDNTDQIVSRNHRCVVEREGNLVFIEAENLSQMEYMPTLSDDFFELQNTKILQSPMQRILSGSRVEKMGENRFGNSEFTTKQNKKRKQGGEKSCLERWNNLSDKKRILFGSEIKICEMPNRFDFNVKKRWLYCRVSANNGKAIRKDIIENGVRTSYRPRPNKQRFNEFNVIFNKQGTQTIRMGKTYSTTLATITPFEYTGVIFCPTVSTGCFVARRNGKIFITGNSGFPKSHNISKAIDKMKGAERDIIGNSENSRPNSERGNGLAHNDYGKVWNDTISATEEAKEWEGWGSAIKPANEPIVLARKPLEKGLSIAQNVLKWGTGAINIDVSRIGNEEREFNSKGISSGANKFVGDKNFKGQGKILVNGRFPSNFILGHHFDCEMKIEKTIYTDTNEEESNEVWNCHDDCPIKILDEQSGELKSGKMTANHNRTTNGSPNGIYGKFDVNHPLAETYGDKGGASRFFYVAKASQWERNFGLQEFEQKQTTGGGGGIGNYLEDINSASGKYGSEKAPSKNIHPTVKPIKLMQYLVRMITPPNGIVLDPFAGSGTTGIACKIDGFNFVGLELSEEYTEIANSRIESFKEEKVFIDETIIYKTRNKEEEEEDENHQLSLF